MRVRALRRLSASVGLRQTGQAFHSPAGERPTFLLAEKHGPKMRPWRVGRAMKPPDYASWLRGSLTARPCADSELARIHSGHPCGPFLRLLASPKRGQVQQHAARSAVPLIHPPVSCRQVLDGSVACGPREGSRGFGCGTGCAFSRTRPVLVHPRGFTVRATGHRVASFGNFSPREKSDSLAGRRLKRLTCLTTVDKRAQRGRRKKRLTRLATANRTKRPTKAQHDR